MHNHIEIITTQQAAELVSHGGVISRHAFQCVDFRAIDAAALADVTFKDCIFMGCRFSPDMRIRLDESNTALTSLPVPYSVFRTTLYDASTLYSGYDYNCPSTIEESYDYKIYQHYLKTGKRATDVAETLARTLHDHSMSDALHDFLSSYKDEDIVAIMGGHAMLRTDDVYRQVVDIAKSLTEQGKLMTTGGGPGAMEATHLGAWLAGRTNSEVDEALTILKRYPSFTDKGWLSSAFEVMKRFPQKEFQSVGIPTWLYGHEPATPFATHIAKYFENSLREDGLLTIAKGGVIYTPGSAGTMQEIFQDAVQNHYLTVEYASPMAFLDVDYWTNELPVYPMLEELQNRGRYRNLLLSISDDVTDIVQTILDFNPKK